MSAAIGPDFPCTYRGGHAPIDPRGSNFSVTFRKGVISLLVNGVPVLSYHDQDPLNEGMVGLWTWDARMNLADVSISAQNSAVLAPVRLYESLEAGAGSVLRLVRAAEKSFSQQAAK